MAMSAAVSSSPYAALAIAESTKAGIHEAQVSSVLIRALVDVVQQRGFASEALLGQAADELYSDPLDRRVPLATYQALVARAIDLTAEPALGLYCGREATQASFGLMGALVSYTHSLRHAIQLVSQFHALVVDDMRLQLSEHAGIARLSCSIPRTCSVTDRSMTELIVSGLARMLQSFGCARVDIHAVCFEYTRPAHHRAYSVTFCGAERFAQAYTGIEFSKHVLDRLHLHRQPELEALLRAQAERSLERLARPLNCVERLRVLLARHGQALSMARAARELGLSVRSLRRRLQDEGSSFRMETQSALQESACSMLRNPDFTLQAIAHMLRFADAAAFHKAFKRWTRLTPAEYRSRAPL
jgi:AraC-like DNA-binding protein